MSSDQTRCEGSRPRRERRLAALGEPALLAGAAGPREGGRQGLRRARRADHARPCLRRREEARLHRRAGEGDPDLPQDRSRCAPRRRRGGVGVHEPHPRRADEAPGTDPHARQLERRVAGPRRHAQRERLADEGRDSLQLDLERGLRGRLRPRRAAAVARRGAHRPRHEPRPGDRGPDVQRQLRRGPGARRRARRGAAARPGHHGRLRRGLHGDVQRDHPRRPPARDGPLQGAAVAVDALRRDARGPGRDGAAPLRVAARSAA